MAFQSRFFLSLSASILARHREYYHALEAANQHLEITPWLNWFSAIALDAQRRATGQVQFSNRQDEGVRRAEGQNEYAPGESVAPYVPRGAGRIPWWFERGELSHHHGRLRRQRQRAIWAGLVELGGLTRTGERRHTRYWLNLTMHPGA